MVKKQLRHHKSPVRLPSEIKRNHQGYFLHYLNNDVPEISQELQKLTTRCKSLFGKFPVQIKTINDPNQLGCWFYVPHEDVEERHRWIDINRLFRECIWQEERDSLGRGGWFRFLARNDEELRKIIEYEESIKKEAFLHIEGLSDDQLNHYRDIFAFEYTKPKETLDVLDLQFSFSHAKSTWLYKNNEQHKNFIDLKYSKLEPLKEFQSDFDSVVKRYHLRKDWLAQSAFHAIWNGTGRLQMEATFIEFIPKEVIYDVKDNLKQDRTIKIPDKIVDEYDDLFMNEIPLPNPFQYKEQYWIYYRFEYYQKQAVEAYKQHLQTYFQIVKASLKKFGYKEHRGDQYDYERLKWLVYWNTNICSKEELLQEIMNTTNPDIDPSTINKAFSKFFQDYDLPVRGILKGNDST